MEPTNKHRNRGGGQCLPNCVGSRRWVRKHTRYPGLRGILVITPDGFGTILGDTNMQKKVKGSRKFIVKLEDSRIRRYSWRELSDSPGEFKRLMFEAWNGEFDQDQRRRDD